MSDPIENLVMTETARQGVKPNAEAVQKAAIELAGATMVGGLIYLPGRGTISPADFVRSLRASMPEAFGGLEDKHDTKQSSNLTERYRAEIEATRSKRRLPEGWAQTRAKYGKDTLTGRMLAEREQDFI
jgi:hypothetical protein